MRPLRRIICIAVAVAATTLITGCSSSSGSAAPTASAPAETQAVTAPTSPVVKPTSSSAPAVPAAMLYLADCYDPTKTQIATVNMETKALSAWRNITPPSGDGSVTNLPGPCSTGQSNNQTPLITSYAPDFAYLGGSKAMDDGSVHAGVINLTTGAFTDLAQSLHKSDFSSSAITDKPTGFLPNGDFLFESDDKTYESAPPYQTVTPRSNTIGILSPKGDRTIYIGEAAYDFVTMLRLPSNTRNQFGDEYSTYDPAYAPISVGTDRTDSGCTQPQWLDDATLLCYYNSAATTGVVNPGESILTLSSARVVRTSVPTCHTGDPCWIKYVWNVNEDAMAFLLPDNSRTNANFVPSPDGKSIVFTSTLGDMTSLELVARPSHGKPATPTKISVTDINDYGHIIPIAWR